MGLSVTVITKNEEANLAECLESVSWADEIVVVDSGSTDQTLAVCSRFTDRTFVREFTGFSDQKGFALAQARCDWVLNIDADEKLSPTLQEEVRRVVASETEHAGYWMPRLTTYMGRPIRHCGWYPDMQLRLFRKAKARYPERLVHERIEVDGPCGRLSGDLLHRSYSSFRQHVEKQEAYAFAMAEQMLKDGRKASVADMAILPLFSFFKKYVLRRGFQDGVEGFLVSSMDAYYVFMKYARLWEIRQEAPED